MTERSSGTFTEVAEELMSAASEKRKSKELPYENLCVVSASEAEVEAFVNSMTWEWVVDNCVTPQVWGMMADDDIPWSVLNASEAACWEEYHQVTIKQMAQIFMVSLSWDAYLKLDGRRKPYHSEQLKALGNAMRCLPPSKERRLMILAEQKQSLRHLVSFTRRFVGAVIEKFKH